jgi:hypothetical protein
VVEIDVPRASTDEHGSLGRSPMHTEIVWLTNATQPGWDECVLRDASIRERLLADKVPTFLKKLPQFGIRFSMRQNCAGKRSKRAI